MKLHNVLTEQRISPSTQKDYNQNRKGSSKPRAVIQQSLQPKFTGQGIPQAKPAAPAGTPSAAATIDPKQQARASGQFTKYMQYVTKYNASIKDLAAKTTQQIDQLQIDDAAKKQYKDQIQAAVGKIVKEGFMSDMVGKVKTASSGMKNAVTTRMAGRSAVGQTSKVEDSIKEITRQVQLLNKTIDAAKRVAGNNPQLLSQIKQTLNAPAPQSGAPTNTQQPPPQGQVTAPSQQNTSQAPQNSTDPQQGNSYRPGAKLPPFSMPNAKSVEAWISADGKTIMYNNKVYVPKS